MAGYQKMIPTYLEELRQLKPKADYYKNMERN